MPSSVNVQGLVTRRPGVYSIVDASALAGRELDINNVAIVGEFDFLETATPTHAASFRRLADLEFSNIDLTLLASILYNSASDDRVTGGPNRTTLVNVAPVGQANNTFDGANGQPSIIMKSKAWGPTGNKVIATIANGTSSGKKYTVLRDGRTEVFDDVGLDDVISFKYTAVAPQEASDVSLAYDNTSGLVIVNKLDGLNATASPTKLAFDGVVKINTSVALAGAETLTITVNGTNKNTGAADSEILSFVAPNTTKTTIKEFSAVTTVHAAVGGFGGTWEIEVDAFNLSTSDYLKASDFVARVNAHTAYTATNNEPQATAIDSDELDNATSVNLTVQVDMSANVYAAVKAFVNSTLVTVEKATGADEEPANTVSAVSLAGGTYAAPTLSNWQEAFESIETESIQIVATKPNDLLDVSGVSGVHLALRDHCVRMAGEGGDERNGWVGAEEDDTLSALKVRSAALNSRFISLVFDDATVVGPTGNEKKLSPSAFAIMCAGMQSGTAVGTPLTGKRPNVITVGHNSSIKPTADASELLKYGLTFVTTDRLGPKIERSITTYQTDDNPIFSEMSSVESVNTSIRDLRANLETMIGDPAKITTKGRIRSLTIARLNDQVAEDIIKAFIDSSVTVEDLGDTFTVSYQMAPIEPVNFIVVTAMVQRISA